MKFLEIKLIIFVLVSVMIAWISRRSLRSYQSHGFYRFFAWEAILILFLLNIDFWFTNPFQFLQIISWILLTISLILIIAGVHTLFREGNVNKNRDDPTLALIEKTSQLVTSGIYKKIRHPFYSSLLFLGWGIFFKHVTVLSLILSVFIAVVLFITAKKEETENLHFFGEEYERYMKRTRRFIPFLF